MDLNLNKIVEERLILKIGILLNAHIFS